MFYFFLDTKLSPSVLNQYIDGCYEQFIGWKYKPIIKCLFDDDICDEGEVEFDIQFRNDNEDVEDVEYAFHIIRAYFSGIIKALESPVQIEQEKRIC